MLKISFTGDVSLDKPLLKAAQKENGDFGFDEVFADIKDIFDSSDYVVGNLETVFAGSSKGYNVKPFGYNSPDEFLVALKKIGFDAFSMANNHCLDEGIDGLTRTVQVCKKNNIDISGVKVADVDNKIVFTLSGVKVCLLSYAHTINRSRNTDKIKNISEYVNLLYPYNAVKAQGIKSKFIHMLPLQLRESIKRKLGIPTVTKVIDHIFPEMINHNYIKRLVEDIQLAKKNADIVIMCVHCGGQFNDFPGEYSEYIFNVMKDAGADVIIGNHPHIIQRVDVDDTCVKAYSLGGFSLSPSAEYVHPEAKAEYSMILHVYIDTDTKEIASITATFIKGEEDDTHYLRLRTVDTMNEKEKDVIQKKIGMNELQYNSSNELIIR